MLEMLVNISNFLSPIFYKILYMSIVGSILGVFIIILTKYFDNKLSAKMKYLIMLIPIIFLMVPITKIQVNIDNDFIITSVIDRVENKLSNVPNLSTTSINKNEDNKLLTANENNVLGTIQNQASTNIKDDAKGITIYEMLPITWLVGASISFIIFIIGNISLNYKITKSRKLEDNKIKTILDRCKTRLGINKEIEIKLQYFNMSPCIYGIIRPQILLTEEFCKKDHKIIENVFMHELSHYKRKDMITNYLLLIMTSLHWFNPFVYGFFKKIRQEMELATDEIALSKMNKEQKKQYGFTLINLLQTYETKRIVPKMLCVTDDSKNMERRIKMIKSSTRLKKYKISIVLFIIIMILCTIIPFVIKPTSAKQVTSIDEESLYEKVEQYLIKLEQQNHYNEKLEFTDNGDNFKTFIDMAKLGTSQNGEETYVYVWALIKNYYGEEEIVSSGSSMPYKFTIKNNEIVDYQIPEDGNRYSKSIQAIFPKDIIKKMEKSEELVDEAKLEKQADEYYESLNKNSTLNELKESFNTEDNNIVNKNYFVGKWKPYKAEQNGMEISLREVYGSGISYGGELILNDDGTYTAFIGVYSQDNIYDLQGTYKTDKNDETVVLTSKSGKIQKLELLEYTNVNSSDIIIRLVLEDDIYVYFTK